MVPDSKIARAAEKLIDQKFYLGNTVKGYDCLNSLKSFYDDIGFNFPTTFEDFTESNYAKKWDEDPELARDTLIRFLMGLGKSVDKNYMLRGDLLILESEPIKPIESSTIRKITDAIGRRFPNLVKEARKILSGKKLLVFPAIFLGNGNMMIVATTDEDDIGPRVVPLRFFKKYIKECRRLID